MNLKKKGTDAERDLIKKFWESGWAAIRSAGSGSMHYPSPDLLVGKNGRRLAIECKITSATKKYLPISEIHLLDYFSKTFGAESWIAVKFPKNAWYFFTLEDMNQTGKNYVATIELAKTKGLSFEELISV